MSSVRRAHPIVWLLALVVPLLVVSTSAQWLQRPAEVTGKAKAMERTLRKGRRPDVVVLGSSLARTNVRMEVLADGLGVSRKKASLLALPNATAAHWYAIMKNRVFGNGYEPKLVIIVGALTTMVTPDVLMDSNVERLVNQLSGDEPVIGRKVFGAERPSEFRYLYMREQAGQLRDGLLEGYRDLALAYTFRGKHSTEAGARLAERANEIVFADEKMDYELYNRSSTGLYVGAVDEIELEGIDIEAESLLPDIARLAVAHGARAVFVRTPFPPSNSDNDYVPPDYEAQAIRVIEEAGGIYIDMRGLPLADSHFRDMRHMSREGGEIFTRALAQSLTQMGALSRKGPAASSVALAPSDVQRSAPPAALTDVTGHAKKVSPCAWRIQIDALDPLQRSVLKDAGHPDVTPLRAYVNGEPLPTHGADVDGCVPGVRHDARGLLVVTPGKVPPSSLSLDLVDTPSFRAPDEAWDSWWVYPGTALTFTFDTPWEHDPELFEAFMLGHVFGGGGRDVALRVADQSVPTDGEGNRVWAAGRPAPPAEGPWTVTVSSPVDGPWVLIQNLSVGRAPFSADLVGLPELLAGASVRMVGGKVEDTNVAPVFDKPPPELTYGGKVRYADKELPYLALPRYRKLADAAGSRSAYPHKCSPIRIVEDGELVDAEHATCFEMANLQQGRTCHAGNVFYFTARDSSDVRTNGRTYEAVLDPTRICDRLNQRDTTPIRGAVWIYPGDKLALTLPADRLQGFYDGANRFDVAFDPMMYDVGDALQVRLRVDDRVVLDEKVVATGKRREYRRQILEPSLPPRTDDVVVEIDNLSDGYWLWVMGSLSEDYDYGGIKAARAAQEAGDADAPADTDAGEDTDVGDTDVFDAVEPPVTEEPPLQADDGSVGLAAAWPPDQLARVGEIPTLPVPKAIKPRPDDRFDVQLYSLWPISHRALGERGMGDWSPVRLVDGAGLMPVARSKKVLGRKACTRCSWHHGKSYTATSPEGDPEALHAVLQPDAPNTDVDGAPLAWVYPGTAMRFGFDRPWSGEEVTVIARVALFPTGKQADYPAPRLRVGDTEVAFEPAERGWEARVTRKARQREAWWFDVRLAPSAPFALVMAVDVVDADGRHSVWRLPGVVAEEDEAAP